MKVPVRLRRSDQMSDSTRERHRRPRHLRRSRVGGAMALLGVVALLSACGSSSPKSSTPPSSASGSGSASTSGSASGSTTTAGAAASGSTLTIGSIIDLTGPGANGGAAQQAGIKYYVHKVNQSGGVDGHQIKIKYCDTKSTPTGGATCATQLSGVNSHVVLLSGALPSAQGAIPHLSGVVGISVLPVLFPKAGTDVFQAEPLEGVYVAPLIKAMKSAKLTTIGVLYTSDSSGTHQLAAVKKAAGAAGLKVVSEPTSPTATNVTTELLHLKSGGSQAIFLASIGTATLTALTSYHSLGLSIPVVVGAQADTNSFLKALPFAVPPKLYGLSTLYVGKTGLTPAEQSAWSSYTSSFKAFAHQPPDEETTSALRTVCDAVAALKGTHVGSSAAMAKFLSSSAITCLGSDMKFNVHGLNVVTGVPGALTQAGPSVSDGWGAMRNPL